MKMLLTVTGKKLFDTVTETKEVDVEVGCGVRFLAHGTRWSVLGEILEVDEPGQRVRAKLPDNSSTWVELNAIRDVISKDDLHNSRLQNLIDHGMRE